MTDATDAVITPESDGSTTVTVSNTETTPSPDPDKDWKAEAEKWKSLSRKHESSANQQAKQLEELRTAQMTETEKAIADAEQRGRESALASMRVEIAETKLRAAATGKVADIEALMELVDVNRFVTADGVDDNAIAAAVEKFTKVAPAPTAPKFGAVEMGQQGNRPRQLTRDDIRTMNPDQIEDARIKGQLDTLLGINS